MMNFAPNVLEHIFSGIRELAGKIKSTSKQVKANKSQSERLSERVDRLVKQLEQKNVPKLTDNSIKDSLEDFQNFLTRCLTFLKKFTDANWFQRIMRNSNHDEQFRQLNEELTYHSQEFHLGLSMTILNRLQAQNKLDAKNDLEEINEIMHTRQTALVSSPVVKPRTTLPPTASPKTDSQHRHKFHHAHHDALHSNHHRARHGSMQVPHHSLHSMNHRVHGHRPSVANHFHQ